MIIHSASPDEPVIGVLDRMQKEDINQMPVASEGHIVGMITRDTILRFLQTRLQLGRFAATIAPPPPWRTRSCPAPSGKPPLRNLC